MTIYLYILLYYIDAIMRHIYSHHDGACNVYPLEPQRLC